MECERQKKVKETAKEQMSEHFPMYRSTFCICCQECVNLYDVLPIAWPRAWSLQKYLRRHFEKKSRFHTRFYSRN